MEDSDKGINISIKNPEFIISIIFLLVIFVLTLKVTLTTPIVFGDEGFHVAMSRSIAQTVELPKYVPFEGTTLFRAGFFRPPVWNITLASFFWVFGSNELIPKLLTPFIILLTGLATLALVKRLYNSPSALIASVALVTFPSVVTYSVLYYYASLLILMMALFFLTFLIGVKENNRKFLFLSGIFGGLALLTNQAAIAAYVVVAITILFRIVKDRKILSGIRLFSPMIIVLLLIPVAFVVRNIGLYNAPICASIPYLNFFSADACTLHNFKETYKFAGQAIPQGTEAGVFNIGLVSYLEFAYGNIWFAIFGLVSGLILLYVKQDDLFVPITIFLVLLLIIFPYIANRAEDTARYSLVWISGIALSVGLFFGEIYEFVRKYQKYLTVVIILLVIFIGYTNASTKLQVMSSVKQFSPEFFKGCNWIKNNTPVNSTIFTIWGHNAAYNCERNIAPNMADVLLSYDNLNFTLSVLKQHQINYLFIQKFSIDSHNQGYADNYPLAFVNAIDGDKIDFEKVFESGPSVKNCLSAGGCDGTLIYKVNI